MSSAKRLPETKIYGHTWRHFGAISWPSEALWRHMTRGSFVVIMIPDGTALPVRQYPNVTYICAPSSPWQKDKWKNVCYFNWVLLLSAQTVKEHLIKKKNLVVICTIPKLEKSIHFLSWARDKIINLFCGWDIKICNYSNVWLPFCLLHLIPWGYRKWICSITSVTVSVKIIIFFSWNYQ